MLILIAESKTMTACDGFVTPELYEKHHPEGELRADKVMAGLAAESPTEIVERSGLNLSMAIKLHKMAVEFPDKTHGQAAREAFTGVVFKAIDYKTMMQDNRANFQKCVRIISSLYGYLRPDDIIKPYRMDYTSRLAPTDVAMSAYWNKAVTESLALELKATGTTEILNLLPRDAAKCIDWKTINKLAKVWTVDFKDIKDGGKLATPHAGLLKKLRGHLLREIVTRNIVSVHDLLSLKTDLLLPMGETDTAGHIAFYL